MGKLTTYSISTMFQSSGRRHVARVACVNYFQMSVLA